MADQVPPHHPAEVASGWPPEVLNWVDTRTSAQIAEEEDLSNELCLFSTPPHLLDPVSRTKRERLLLRNRRRAIRREADSDLEDRDFTGDDRD